MNFAIAGNSLLNDGEVIANFVPRIRGLYSANPEEPLQLLLEVTREGAPPQTIACGAVGPVELRKVNCRLHFARCTWSEH